MKRALLTLVTIGLLAALTSCGGTDKPKDAAKETKTECADKKDSACCKEKKEGCCKELTEEQKADMAAWNDWDNQTPEKKQELVTKRKECIDKRMAEKKEKCEAKEGEEKKECPEAAKKCAEFKAKWDNWANLTIDEQKALIDECTACCKKACEKKEGECKHDHGHDKPCNGTKPE